MSDTLCLRILSDIHVDSHRAAGPLPAGGPADLDLLAGDWANGSYLLEHGLVGMDFARPVLAVPGNHEWWGRDIAQGHADLRQAIARSDAPVHLLDRGVYEHAGWTVLGCTLWTDFALHGDWPTAAATIAARMPDFHGHIRVDGEPLTPERARALHAQDCEWLAQQLAAHDPARTIVMTHFGPHAESCHPAYREHPWRETNPYFVSDTGLVERFQPALWVHGHTHMPLDYRVGRTRVLCNPRGYRNEQPAATLFDPGQVVTLHAGGGG